MTTTRIDALEAARRLQQTRYAGARVLFLAGSVMRGEATPASDLDIVVVFDHLPNAYREAFFEGGWPVEAFVHDAETLDYFFSEVDAPTGQASLAAMVLEGVEIPEATEFSQALKRLAASRIEAGAPPLDDEALRKMRCFITDVVDDIRYPRSKEELTASGARLYQALADFYLRSQRLWSATGKTIPRRLRQVDAEFQTRFCAAFETLFVEARPEAVITLAEEILLPFDGFAFDGQRFDATPGQRQPLDKIRE